MAVIETTQIAPAGTWTADPIHSSIGFSVKHMGVATFTGSFADYAATLIGGDEPKLEGVAKVESIITQDENLNVHLLSPEFFDADRFPELRFEATRFDRDGNELVVRGELTLRGETRPVELRGTISDPIDDPYGRQRIGLDLATAVDRRDFGLNWQAELPSGGDVLGYDVKLNARLSLVKA
jgi:polyisoprenoid-binding protein YceI